MRRRSKLKKRALLDGEAEDDDLAEGRRSADADDDDRGTPDEYENDGFLTNADADAEDSAVAAQQRKAAHASLDAATDNA